MKLKIVDNLKKYDRILVTSALPYVNYEPHLGHLAGAVLSADVYHRYLDLKQVENIYICGTDENGATSEVSAKQQNLTPKELCDKYHAIHKQAYHDFNIDFTYFGRTSSKVHYEKTVDIFNKLKQNNYIIEQEAEQAYCDHCKIELADRYIIGTCPYCGYEHATGGQCEKCGKLLDAKDLIDPKCAICYSKPRFIKTTHLYLDLPKLKSQLKSFVISQENWAENAKKFSLNMIPDLKPRAITRRLHWGVKVPNSDLVFYVWFDAPIGYISFTYEALGREKADIWWKGNTKLVQFMGKDNIPFHTIIFPAELMGTNDSWILVDSLSSTEYLNYENGKFSKSHKRGIFCTDALKTGIPVDYWRFYLMYIRPEKSDTNFVWDDFYERINSDLVGNLVNFIYRTISLTNKYFSKIPNHDFDTILDAVYEKVNSLDKLMDQIKIKEYVKTLLELSTIGNRYLQENEPWKNINTNPDQVKHVLGNAMEIVKILAIVSKPIIPNISETVFNCLKLKQKGIRFWNDLKKPIIGELNVKRIAEKLKLEEINKLKLKYSGSNFEILDLRVAKIESIEKVQNSSKLYKLLINLGTEKRQLIAGLQKYYSEDELLGRNIVVIANLKPAKLAGLISQGMLLAADSNNEVKLLEVPDSSPGMQVYINEKYVQSNIITLDDFKKIKLSIKDSIVQYNNMPLKTDKEFVRCHISDEGKAKIR